MKLDVPRKEGEQAVQILKFDREQPDLQRWPTLFNIPASEETTAEEVLVRCRDLLQRTYELDYKLEQ